jgi:CRP/FNR family transcriptional regulator, cyclic AMP receptor protein
MQSEVLSMRALYNWIKSIFNKPEAYMQYRRFGIFKDLSSFELYLLHSIMHKRSFKDGEVLFEAGYPMEVIYCIEQGEVLLKNQVSADLTHTIGPNQVLGLWDMFCGAKRQSTAYAHSEVSALAIATGDFWDLIEGRPKMGLKILRAICVEIAKDALSIQDSGK